MNVTMKTAGLKMYQTRSEEVKKTDTTEMADAKQTVQISQAGVDTYVPSKADGEEKVNTYKPNISLAEQLKTEQSQVQERFLQTVRDTITQQGKTAALGNGIWKTIAQGGFSVDASLKADAEAAVSEDGYWGVSQTSQRIVDFAKALAGTSPEMAKTVREAFEKGYRQAEEAWGGSLPSICGQTYDRVMSLFDEWENGTETA